MLDSCLHVFPMLTYAWLQALPIAEAFVLTMLVTAEATSFTGAAIRGGLLRAVRCAHLPPAPAGTWAAQGGIFGPGPLKFGRLGIRLGLLPHSWPADACTFRPASAAAACRTGCTPALPQVHLARRCDS